MGFFEKFAEKYKWSGWKSFTPGSLFFQCNICGTDNLVLAEALGRETASCRVCASTVRMRQIVYVLLKEVLDLEVSLSDLKQFKSIHGIGMSDWEVYAKLLAEKLSYTNTFYHQEPKVDITVISESQHRTLDFIVSSDVFEHVAPPVERAFQNAAKMLRQNGIFVFTVPYTTVGVTKEHFPDLFDYTIKEIEGRFILTNKTKSGAIQVFDNLVFHGGPGTTLEMRVFTEPDLIQNLKDAGFQDIKIWNKPVFKFGIHSDHEGKSLPISARIR